MPGLRRRPSVHGRSVGAVAERSLKGSAQRASPAAAPGVHEPGSTVRPCARSVDSELRSSLCWRSSGDGPSAARAGRGRGDPVRRRGVLGRPGPAGTRPVGGGAVRACGAGCSDRRDQVPRGQGRSAADTLATPGMVEVDVCTVLVNEMARRNLLHEMGHIWIDQNVPDTRRERFLELRGLSLMERIDRPVARARLRAGRRDRWRGRSETGSSRAQIPDNEPAQLAAAFELLTGIHSWAGQDRTR